VKENLAAELSDPDKGRNESSLASSRCEFTFMCREPYPRPSEGLFNVGCG